MNATPTPTFPPPAGPDRGDPGADVFDGGADAEAELDAGYDAEAGLDAGVPAPGAAARAGCVAAVTEAEVAAWIARIAEQRDERALSALYDATVSRVHGIVLRVVRAAALAEEVVEDTYFQVWRQALRYDAARGRALGWLLGIARSRAIDAVRREARFAHDALADDEPDAAPAAGAAAGADELLDVARHHAELHRALQALNAQPRQLVALAFFRGLSHEEIAEQTRLPLGTVKSQIRRALLHLRQTLGDAAGRALAC